MGLKSLFSSGAGGVTRAAADSVARSQGEANNLVTQANNWWNDPNRQNQYNDFMDAYRAQLGQATDQQYANAARNTKFATARAGLTGGATDISRQRRNLQDLFSQRVGNEQTVQDAYNNFQNQDRNTYQSLINQAYNVGNTGMQAAQQFGTSASRTPGLWASLYGAGQAAAKAYAPMGGM